MAINTQNIAEFIQSITTTMESSSVALSQMKNKYQPAIQKKDLNNQYSNLDATMTLSLMIEQNKMFCRLLAKIKDHKSFEQLIYKAYQAAEEDRINNHDDQSDYEAIVELLNALVADGTLADLAQNAELWGQIQYVLGISLICISALLAFSLFIGSLILISLFVIPYLIPILPFILLILLSPLLIGSLVGFFNGRFEIGFGLLIAALVLIQPMIYFTFVIVPVGFSLLIAALISIPIYFFGEHQKNNGRLKIDNSHALKGLLESSNW